MYRKVQDFLGAKSCDLYNISVFLDKKVENQCGCAGNRDFSLLIALRASFVLHIISYESKYFDNYIDKHRRNVLVDTYPRHTQLPSPKGNHCSPHHQTVFPISRTPQKNSQNVRLTGTSHKSITPVTVLSCSQEKYYW